ncbi:hypothetical protein ACXZ9C_10550 [Streptococcus agalactiae]
MASSSSWRGVALVALRRGWCRWSALVVVCVVVGSSSWRRRRGVGYWQWRRVAWSRGVGERASSSSWRRSSSWWRRVA